VSERVSINRTSKQAHAGPRRCRAPRASEAGFTLLELVTVVLIISILSAAVVPMFGGSVRSMRVENALDQFIAVMKNAHERAVIEMVEHRFYIDYDNNVYWVEKLAGYDEDQEKIFKPASEEYGRKTGMRVGLELKRPRARRDRDRDAYFIAFYPGGAVDEATVRIDHDETSRRIRIETKGRLGQFEISGEDQRSVWRG